MYHGVEGSKFTVVNGTDWIPTHVNRGFDEEKIVRSLVLVVSQVVLMRRYQCFDDVVEVSDMLGKGVQKYEF